MVGVDDGSLQVDSQPKIVGLVWGLVATWHLVCIHRMNRVNSHNDSTINIDTGITISVGNRHVIEITQWLMTITFRHSWSIMILWGLTSRCMIPILWQ